MPPCAPGMPRWYAITLRTASARMPSRPGIYRRFDSVGSGTVLDGSSMNPARPLLGFSCGGSEIDTRRRRQASSFFRSAHGLPHDRLRRCRQRGGQWTPSVADADAAPDARRRGRRRPRLGARRRRRRLPDVVVVVAGPGAARPFRSSPRRRSASRGLGGRDGQIPAAALDVGAAVDHRDDDRSPAEIDLNLGAALDRLVRDSERRSRSITPHAVRRPSSGPP